MLSDEGKHYILFVHIVDIAALQIGIFKIPSLGDFDANLKLKVELEDTLKKGVAAHVLTKNTPKRCKFVFDPYDYMTDQELDDYFNIPMDERVGCLWQEKAALKSKPRMREICDKETLDEQFNDNLEWDSLLSPLQSSSRRQSRTRKMSITLTEASPPISPLTPRRRGSSISSTHFVVDEIIDPVQEDNPILTRRQIKSMLLAEPLTPDDMERLSVKSLLLTPESPRRNFDCNKNVVVDDRVNPSIEQASPLLTPTRQSIFFMEPFSPVEMERISLRSESPNPTPTFQRKLLTASKSLPNENLTHSHCNGVAGLPIENGYDKVRKNSLVLPHNLPFVKIDILD